MVTAYTWGERTIREWAQQVRNDGFYAAQRVQHWTYQLEICPTTERSHVQLYVYFSSNVSLRTVQRRLSLANAHCEPCRGTPEQAAAYCSKDDTRDPADNSGPWAYGPVPQQGRRSDLIALHEAIQVGLEDNVSPITLELGLLRDAELFGAMTRAGSTFRRWMRLEHAAKHRDTYSPVPITLLDWQVSLTAILDTEKPKRRRIFWIWSRVSGTGKTTYLQWIRQNRNAAIGNAKLNDFLYSYQSSLAPIILFNLPRHQELSAQLLETLEALSDQGVIPCTKYESCEVLVYAHIVVFANIQPPVIQLPDRITEIHLEEEPIVEIPPAPAAVPLVRADARVGPCMLAALGCDEAMPTSVSMDMSTEDAEAIFE